MGGNSIWTTNQGSKASITWKSIMKAVAELREGFEMKLNSGNSLLWFDDWTGKGPLYMFPDYVYISDYIKGHLVQW